MALCCSFLGLRPPPRSALFPYTTLFRSETNVKFGRFEADFVWRDERVIVELDSPTFHSGPGVFQRDREKDLVFRDAGFDVLDRKSTRLNSSHANISYAVFCLKKKTENEG